jgi:hypothetical protein
MKHCLMTVLLVAVLSQGAILSRAADEPNDVGSTTTPGTTDGKGPNSKQGPALTGERRPLYRLQRSDVIDI